MSSALLKLDKQLCFPLYAASRLVTRLYQPLLAELDITYPQYLVFLLLWEKDERAVTDISNCLYLETNTLTPLLQRLEAKALIVRKRDHNDERRVLVTLTKKGKELEQRAKKIPKHFKNELLHEIDFSREELIQLNEMLRKLINTQNGQTTSN